MNYHFKVHEEKTGYWAECLELKGCLTQGDSMEDLKKNMEEALYLYLDEPFGSNAAFPLPDDSIAEAPDLFSLAVDPKQAFSIILRNYRIRNRMTQAAFQHKLGMRNRNSYARLENRANPSLETICRIKTAFPDFPIEKVFHS